MKPNLNNNLMEHNVTERIERKNINIMSYESGYNAGYETGYSIGYDSDVGKPCRSNS